MEIKKFFQSKSVLIITLIIVGLIVLLLVFKAGTLIGYRKAGFSFGWSDNYHRNFAGPRAGFLKDFNDRDFIEPNGTFGQIIKISTSTPAQSLPSQDNAGQAISGQLATLVVKGSSDAEKVIIITDKTIINRFRESIKPADLKLDDFIVVIGEPNNAGQIEAKLIRILPPPPSAEMPFGPRSNIKM